jgi:hypothetical protein
MKEVKFITALPDETYYTWQVHLWLESLKEIDKSQHAIVLIYRAFNKKIDSKWHQIQELYPEAEFNYIQARKEDNMNIYVGIYIPIIRSYCMWRHLKSNPSLGTTNVLFFCDSDILFSKKFNIDKFIEDDINYVSDAVSYLGAEYFENKIKDVLSDKLEKYKHRDVLAELLSIVGISKDRAIENQENSGGVQYILKNSTASYWNKVMNNSLIICTYMQKVNREYFSSQEIGYQSWCSDMWGILWNLWFADREVKVIPELNFSWGSCKIEQLEKSTIFHNAGITGEIMVDEQGTHLCFYKGKYHSGDDPTKDPMLDKIIKSKKSQKYCTWYYAKKLKELSKKYKLNY